VGNVSAASTALSVRTLDVTAPSVPSDLAASAISAGGFSVTWNAATDSGSAGMTYEVYNGATLAGTVSATNYTFSDLSEYSLHSITVRAKDVAGNVSAASTALNVRTLDITLPTAPTNLQAASITPTSFSVSWTASTDLGGSGVSTYRVFLNGTQVAEETTTSYAFSGLTQNSAYEVTVKAVDHADNVSASGATITVNTPDPNQIDTTAPSIPTNVTATFPSTKACAVITWNVSTDNLNVSGYEIFLNGLLHGTTASTTYQICNLLPATSYTITVAAFDASANKSEPSNTYTVTTGADAQVPTAPQNLTASERTQTSLKLNWSVATDDFGVALYQIFRVDPKATVKIAETATTEFTVSGLKQETTYRFLVRARDVAGKMSVASVTLTAKTLGDIIPPTAPTNVKAVFVTPIEAHLIWTPATDNRKVTSYKVFKDGTEVGTAIKNTFKLSGLTPETAYQVTVKAMDAATNASVASQTLAITTPADSENPQRVEELLAHSLTANSFVLRWTPSTDDVAVTNYKVYNGETLLATVPASTNPLQWSFTDLLPETEYTLTVVALDASEKTSAVSDSLKVTTRATGYTAGPALTVDLLPRTYTAAALSVKYTLLQTANVRFKLLSKDLTTVNMTLSSLTNVLKGTKTQSLKITTVPDGEYILEVTASVGATGAPTTVSKTVIIDRTVPVLSNVAKTDLTSDAAEATANVSFDLSEPALVSVAIYNSPTAKTPIRTYILPRELGAGSHTVLWDGRNAANVPVADGNYIVHIFATDRAKSKALTQKVTVVVERNVPLFTGVSVARATFKVDGKALNTFTFTLSEAATASLLIVNAEGATVKTLLNGARAAGIAKITWIGRADNTQLVPAGVYTYKLNAVDGASKNAVEVSGTFTVTR
jgi:chitodextrinase/flagellar hook assembly protein FlgD